MYPMGNIPVKPDLRLSMSSNPRPRQKQWGSKLSELVKQSLLTCQKILQNLQFFTPLFVTHSSDWWFSIRSNVSAHVANFIQDDFGLPAGSVNCPRQLLTVSTIKVDTMRLAWVNWPCFGLARVT